MGDSLLVAQWSRFARADPYVTYSFGCQDSINK